MGGEGGGTARSARQWGLEEAGGEKRRTAWVSRAVANVVKRRRRAGGRCLPPWLPGEEVRVRSVHSVFVHVVLAIDPVHPPDVESDQPDERVDRALVRHPEAQFEPADPEAIQRVGEEDGGTE